MLPTSVENENFSKRHQRNSGERLLLAPKFPATYLDIIYFREVNQPAASQAFGILIASGHQS